MNIEARELNEIPWVKEWKNAQEFHSEQSYLNAIQEVEKIDPQSMFLSKLCNSLADEYIDMGKFSEANFFYIQAITNSDLYTNDVLYAYNSIKKFNLSIDPELEKNILDKACERQLLQNNVYTIGDIVATELSSDEVQDVEKKEIAHVNGFILTKNKNKKKACCSDCEKTGGNCQGNW